jgi:hypothetical protein
MRGQSTQSQFRWCSLSRRRGMRDKAERGLRVLEFGNCLRVWVCGDFGEHVEKIRQDGNTPVITVHDDAGRTEGVRRRGEKANRRAPVLERGLCTARQMKVQMLDSVIGGQRYQSPPLPGRAPPVIPCAVCSLPWT